MAKLTICFDDTKVTAELGGGLTSDHLANAAHLLLRLAIKMSCSCAGCTAARPHLEAASVAIDMGFTASAAALGSPVPTTTAVGRA